MVFQASYNSQPGLLLESPSRRKSKSGQLIDFARPSGAVIALRSKRASCNSVFVKNSRLKFGCSPSSMGGPTANCGHVTQIRLQRIAPPILRGEVRTDENLPSRPHMIKYNRVVYRHWWIINFAERPAQKMKEL